jgi:hypothetical protein
LRAEEDPAYEPFNKTGSAPPPKKSVSLADKPEKYRAPVVPNRDPSSYIAPKNAYKHSEDAVPTPPVTSISAPSSAVSNTAVPSGPKVKYILNGRPVYEGDPDPLAESKARAMPSASADVRATTAPPASVRLDYLAQVPPKSRVSSASVPAKNEFGAYGSGNRNALQDPAPLREVTSNERKVKYILDGKPVYEGDPDPVAASKSGAPAAASSAGNFSANAVLSRQSPYSPAAAAPAQSAALPDDLIADRPAPGAVTSGVVKEGELVLEEFAAPGPVNSKAKKCYAALSELKKNVEVISRCMDNRGKENARLMHASENVLTNINDLAAIWPTSEAFMDVCALAKRSALVFNSELSEVPWTWTRVRWSFDAMVKGVRALRAYAKTQADAEPKPQMIVTKEGAAVYIDAPETAPLDPRAQRQEDASKAAKEQLARIKANNESREERKKTKLTTDLDGN